MMQNRLTFSLSMHDALLAMCALAAEAMHLRLHSSTGQQHNATASHLKAKQSLANCMMNGTCL